LASLTSILTGLAASRDGGFFAAGFFAVKQVKAEDSGAEYPLIVQRLIAKFNLDGDEVENVFAEVREERQVQMQARFEERLTQLVDEGSLTEEQRQAIIAKRQQLRQESQDWQNLSKEERHELMEQHRDEMQNWADEQGIDVSLVFANHHGGEKGFGPGHGLGPGQPED